MKDKIEKGDIVLINKTGKYHNQVGEVIEVDYNIFFVKILIVKLGNQEEAFEEKDLQLQTKKPSIEEAIASVDKILELVEQLLNLPTNEKVELPNRLRYLKLDIPKLDKYLIQKNFDNINQILAAARETNSSASFWQEIDPNLEKISWWIRTSL
ncbi:MAG: KOW motif-containing protein [Nostoc desertorum CM1-VF14]|jgi:ribosomal protein L24|nr:KOW motif-containing protein [Nostoc desertorum CM1-VF14]